MHKGGVCIHADELATAALKLLEEKRITSLMVCDGEDAPLKGVLHVHDLWGVGTFLNSESRNWSANLSRLRSP